MKITHLFGAGALTLALAGLHGCAGVQSVPASCYKDEGTRAACDLDTATDENDQATKNALVPDGIVYHLPATQLTIETTYRVDECPGREYQSEVKDAQGNTTIQDKVTDKLEVKLANVNVSSGTVADTSDSGTFVIHTDAARSFFKQVKNLEIKKSNGMLTSVTYEAKDATVSGIAGIVRQLSSFAGGGVPLQGMGPEGLAGDPCRAEIIQALTDRESLKKQVGAAKTALKPFKEAYYADPTDGKRALYDKAAKAVSDAVGKVKAHVGKHLTFNFKQSFVPRPGKKWNDVSCTATTAEHVTTCALGLPLSIKSQVFNETAILAGKLNNLPVEIKIAHVDGAKNSLPVSVPDAESFGVYYREPLPVQMQVWQGNENKILKSHAMVGLAHLGPILRIPVQNGVFDHNKVVIEFDSTGQPTTFSYLDHGVPVEQALKDVKALQHAQVDGELDNAAKEKEVYDKLTERNNAKQKWLESENSLKAAEGAE